MRQKHFGPDAKRERILTWQYVAIVLAMAALVFSACLFGCGKSPRPTTATAWTIVFQPGTADAIDGGETAVLAELDNLAAYFALPLTFSLDSGEATVYVNMEHTGHFVGFCGTGQDCNVWLLTIEPNGNGFVISHPRHLAIVILHEIGHSYGLSHHSDPRNLMFPNPGIHGPGDGLYLEPWQLERMR